jgi:hypothetical protein
VLDDGVLAFCDKNDVMSTPTDNSVAVRDYVAGRMSAAERESFEGRLVTDVNLVRELEESLRLREGLEVLREQKMLRGFSPANRRSALVRFAWGFAGAVAAVLVSVTLYYAKHLPPIVAGSITALSLGSGPAPPVVERYAFVGMRAKDSTPELALPARGALELRALAAVSPASGTFRVTLDQIQTQKISRIGVEEHLVPDSDGFVAIYANTSRLEPGEYLLTVRQDGDQNSAATEPFAFRLVRWSSVPAVQRP